MSISAQQNQIINDFEILEEWDEKYEYLMELASKGFQAYEEEKLPENLVKGCQSKVWLVGEKTGGVILYRSDADSPIPKGLAAVLSVILSGQYPEEIVQAEIDFHQKTGLVNYLSPTRVRGLNAMILKFKSLAAEKLKG